MKMTNSSAYSLILLFLFFSQVPALFVIQWQNIPDAYQDYPSVQANTFTKEQILSLLSQNIQEGSTKQMTWFYMEGFPLNELEKIQRQNILEKEEERKRFEEERRKQQERVIQEQKKMEEARKREEAEKLQKEQQSLSEIQEEERRIKRDLTDHMTLLNLINQERLAAQLPQLELDLELSIVAQRHSEDMRDRNYFDHATKGTGESPQDRASKIGFTHPVGENIAFSPNVSYSHVQFRNSRGHYENYMNPIWYRAGFGFAFQGNQVFVTELFSTRDYDIHPLTVAEKHYIVEEVLDVLNERTPYKLGYNAGLSAVIAQWQKNHRHDNIFQFTRKSGFTGGLMFSYFRISTASPYEIGHQMRLKGYLRGQATQYTQIGIGVAEFDGWIEIAAVYYNET